jgi:hypothetical protein
VGASGWRYVVPYQEDLEDALDALRRQVFADADYLRIADELLFQKIGLTERGTGRAVTLRQDGEPAEIVI